MSIISLQSSSTCTLPRGTSINSRGSLINRAGTSTMSLVIVVSAYFTVLRGFLLMRRLSYCRLYGSFRCCRRSLSRLRGGILKLDLRVLGMGGLRRGSLRVFCRRVCRLNLFNTRRKKKNRKNPTPSTTLPNKKKAQAKPTCATSSITSKTQSISHNKCYT
jgi:hypothetical protein